MAGAEEQSSDYGYDMAHEVKTYLATPPRGTARVTLPTSGPRREPDPGADLGYDAAHEL